MPISIGQAGDVWKDPTGVEVIVTQRDRSSNLVELAGKVWTSEDLAGQGYTFVGRAAPALSTDARLDDLEARLREAGIP